MTKSIYVRTVDDRFALITRTAKGPESAGTYKVNEKAVRDLWLSPGGWSVCFRTYRGDTYEVLSCYATQLLSEHLGELWYKHFFSVS